MPVLIAPFADPDTASTMEFVDLHEPEKVYRIKVSDENSLFPMGDSNGDVILQRISAIYFLKAQSYLNYRLHLQEMVD